MAPGPWRHELEWCSQRLRVHKATGSWQKQASVLLWSSRGSIALPTSSDFRLQDRGRITLPTVWPLAAKPQEMDAGDDCA